jgi:hypothetical protein
MISLEQKAQIEVLDTLSYSIIAITNTLYLLYHTIYYHLRRAKAKIARKKPRRSKKQSGSRSTGGQILMLHHCNSKGLAGSWWPVRVRNT